MAVADRHTETWSHDGESFTYGVNLADDQLSYEVFFDDYSFTPSNHAMVTWPTAEDAWLYHCEEFFPPSGYDAFYAKLNETYDLLGMLKTLTAGLDESAEKVAAVVDLWGRFATALADTTGATANVPDKLSDFQAAKLPTDEVCKAVREIAVKIPANAGVDALRRDIIKLTGMAAVMKVVPEADSSLDGFRRDLESELNDIANLLP